MEASVVRMESAGNRTYYIYDGNTHVGVITWKVIKSKIAVEEGFYYMCRNADGNLISSSVCSTPDECLVLFKKDRLNENIHVRSGIVIPNCNHEEIQRT